MNEINEFSTECVRFAREFFERFGDDQSASKAGNWIKENIDHDNPLPYLCAITMRPECKVWFYDYYYLPSNALYIPMKNPEILHILIEDEETSLIIHPDYVCWNGEVLFDGRSK